MAAVAQWTEYWSVNWKVANSIPGQGTCLGCGPGPRMGAHERQLINVSVCSSLYPFLPPYPSL